ncbi:MAG: extracellular solute-binding protein [Treponema sp.]|nr:extracellular solute-binding protein [Treponema sp.]
MKDSIDELIDEFNSTIGSEKGIVVQTTYVAVAPMLNEKILAAARGDPGSPELPDIAVVYPSIATTLAEKELLLDFTTQLSQKELSAYVPEFLEEGKLGGNALYILPAAKSTEVLYVNMIIFDRFAADTGVSLSQIATVEGLLDAAEKYYRWSGGKAFYYIEDLFHFAMIGFEQLGDVFVTEHRLNLSSPVFQKIWDAYYPLAVKGGGIIFDGYGNYLAKSGDIVCTTGTSAGVTFYPDSVTYADNTKEDAKFAVLPYPVFAGGEKIAVQRGGGFCAFKSNAKKEYAIGVFLKWMNEPAQNLRFTTRNAYMPVTEAAYGDFMTQEISNIKSDIMREMFGTVVAMRKSYKFHVPPVFEGFEEMQKEYKSSMQRAAELSMNEYKRMLGAQNPAAYKNISSGVFEKFLSEH